MFKKYLLNENKGACSGIGTDPKEAGKLRMEPHEKGNSNSIIIKDNISALLLSAHSVHYCLMIKSTGHALCLPEFESSPYSLLNYVNLSMLFKCVLSLSL